MGTELGNAVERFIVNKKYIHMFNEIGKGKNEIRELAQIINVHYNHLSGVVDVFENEGYLASKMNKNKKELRLTKKGLELTEILNQLIKFNMEE